MKIICCSANTVAAIKATRSATCTERRRSNLLYDHVSILSQKRVDIAPWTCVYRGCNETLKLLVFFASYKTLAMIPVTARRLKTSRTIFAVRIESTFFRRRPFIVASGFVLIISTIIVGEMPEFGICRRLNDC